MSRAERKKRVQEFDNSGMLDTPIFSQSLWYVCTLGVFSIAFGLWGFFRYGSNPGITDLVLSAVIVGFGLVLLYVVATGLWARRKNGRGRSD